VTGMEDTGPLLQVNTLSVDPRNQHTLEPLTPTTRKTYAPLDARAVSFGEPAVPSAAMALPQQEKPSAANPLQLHFERDKTLTGGTVERKLPFPM
jgi:hypothetical protein